VPEHIEDSEHDTADASRAVAHLPGLDIEVAHRRWPNAEQISINLQAVPSFAAFGNYLDSANPFAFWARSAQMAAQLVWSPWLAALPWLNVTRALMPPDDTSETPPTVPE
jgi:hypothetical protein